MSIPDLFAEYETDILYPDPDALAVEEAPSFVRAPALRSRFPTAGAPGRQGTEGIFEIGSGTAVAAVQPLCLWTTCTMNSFRCDMLASMALVGDALGALEAPALRAARGAELAKLQMRFVLLRARVGAGSTSAEVLAGVRLLVEDFKRLVLSMPLN